MAGTPRAKLAVDTGEGQVFDRLFTKIGQQRGAFGDQVYDVLGDAVINRSLRELLIEAIRFGERPEAALHLQEVIDGEIGTRFQEVIDERARSYAITALAGPHFAEMQAVTEARVQRVRQAVEERLNAEMRYWDKMPYELKQKELQGKRRGGMTSGHARNRAEEMEARKERRLRELAQELDLSNQPPVVVGGAVVIPQGLLDRRLGADPQRARVKDVKAVDRRAVAAVIAAEKALGREPVEMDHSNPGYDIESREPETGTLYFIEVKGRIEGEDTVTVKARQIRHATNNPDTFRLALVIVPEDETAQPTVRYLLRPFEGREPRFGVVSETFSLSQLLSIAQEPA